MQRSTTIISDLKAAIMEQNRSLFVNIKTDERVTIDEFTATAEMHEHVVDFILTGVNTQKVQKVGIEDSAHALNGQVLTIMERILEVVS
jgi:biopolymer transport protein ExbD